MTSSQEGGIGRKKEKNHETCYFTRHFPNQGDIFFEISNSGILRVKHLCIF